MQIEEQLRAHVQDAQTQAGRLHDLLTVLEHLEHEDALPAGRSELTVVCVKMAEMLTVQLDSVNLPKAEASQ